MPLHQKNDKNEIVQPLDPKPKFIFDDNTINLQDTDLEVPAFLRRQK
ncbi:MAG: hypothetical protein GWP19_10560 [Planctomycetia bacterium]|nr:hypothetical protein [Planctomycetia bacterium]